MAPRRCAVIWLVLLATGLGGCGPEPYTRLNAPPQGPGEERPDWADMYAYHDDQGMMADMSIADMHFVPHTADLSGVGEARLERYAELLAGRGGTINYDTASTDETLVADRLATAKRFLAQAMPSQKSIEVAVGPAGGRGMDHREALAGQAVAKQPEPRQNAYFLRGYAGAEDK